MDLFTFGPGSPLSVFVAIWWYSATADRRLLVIVVSAEYSALFFRALFVSHYLLLSLLLHWDICTYHGASPILPALLPCCDTLLPWVGRRRHDVYANH